MSELPPVIELLGFSGCPNTPVMRDHLRIALAIIGRGWTFEDTDQEALSEDDPRRGWPSPTILVNGCDLFGMTAPPGRAMGCRIYPGRAAPDTGEIAGRLRLLMAPAR